MTKTNKQFKTKTHMKQDQLTEINIKAKTNKKKIREKVVT